VSPDDNAVRWLDTMWLAEDAPYDNELSTLKLRTVARVGGRRSEGTADFKVRVRVDMALPGLERKLRLFVDNSDLDALPGADPLKEKTTPASGPGFCCGRRGTAIWRPGAG
jgi:hypothetical protein